MKKLNQKYHVGNDLNYTNFIKVIFSNVFYILTILPYLLAT